MAYRIMARFKYPIHKCSNPNIRVITQSILGITSNTLGMTQNILGLIQKILGIIRNILGITQHHVVVFVFFEYVSAFVQT